MAIQTIQFAFLTGQTVTVKLFADDGSDTVLDTPTATEATNRTGIYTFTQTDRAAGNYLITVSATGINAEYSLPLTLDTATFWAIERANVIKNNDKTAYSLSQSFPTNFSALAITGGGAVTAGTVSDKTGYSLSSTQTFDLTGNITGNLSGSVGSVASAITLPTIPADWITSSGLASSAVTEIQSGLLTTGTFNSAVAELPAQIADAVWDDTLADHLTAGSTGESLYRTLAIKTKTDNLPSDPADQSSIEAAITSATSGLATAADLATVDTVVDAIKLKTDNLPSDPADQSAVEAAITAATSGLATASSIVSLTTKVDTLDDYVDTEVAAIKAKTDNLPADPADASDIAASFVTVNSKLDAIDDYVDSEVAAIKVVTDRLSGMLVLDGLVYQYTTNALENAPSGGGGGTTVAVYPLNATMPARVYDLNLTFYKNEDGTVVGPISVTSRNANVFEPVGLSGRTLSVRFVDYEGTELLTVANDDITVSGADNNQISFPVTSDLTGSVTETPQDQWHIWTLHDLTSGDNVLIGGKARVLLC